MAPSVGGSRERREDSLNLPEGFPGAAPGDPISGRVRALDFTISDAQALIWIIPWIPIVDYP